MLRNKFRRAGMIKQLAGMIKRISWNKSFVVVKQITTIWDTYLEIAEHRISGRETNKEAT
jgi:hypothetical protein